MKNLTLAILAFLFVLMGCKEEVTEKPIEQEKKEVQDETKTELPQDIQKFLEDNFNGYSVNIQLQRSDDSVSRQNETLKGKVNKESIFIRNEKNKDKYTFSISDETGQFAYYNLQIVKENENLNGFFIELDLKMSEVNGSTFPLGSVNYYSLSGKYLGRRIFTNGEEKSDERNFGDCDETPTYTPSGGGAGLNGSSNPNPVNNYPTSTNENTEGGGGYVIIVTTCEKTSLTACPGEKDRKCTSKFYYEGKNYTTRLYNGMRNNDCNNIPDINDDSLPIIMQKEYDSCKTSGEANCWQYCSSCSDSEARDKYNFKTKYNLTTDETQWIFNEKNKFYLNEIRKFTKLNTFSDHSISTSAYYIRLLIKYDHFYNEEIPISKYKPEEFGKIATIFDSFNSDGVKQFTDNEEIKFFLDLFSTEIVPLGITFIPYGIGDAADIYQSCGKNAISWDCALAIAGVLVPVDEAFDIFRKRNQIKAAWKTIRGYKELKQVWRLISKLDIAEALELRKYPDVLKAIKQASDEGLDGLDALEDAIEAYKDLCTRGRCQYDWKAIQAFFKRGNDFNRKGASKYGRKNCEIVLADKKRLDTYIHGKSIISRKATDIDNITEATWRNYCKELVTKYKVGKLTNSRKLGDASEQVKLFGKYKLEIPISNQNAINLERFKQIAKEYGKNDHGNSSGIEIIFLRE